MFRIPETTTSPEADVHHRDQTGNYVRRMIALAEAPRRPDRAKGHLITTAELNSILGFKGEWDDEFGVITDEAQTLISDFIKGRLDLRRGDIIILEPYLDEPFPLSGFYIYDGEQIGHLTIDDNGSIPEEFQVIKEFPLKYWVDFQHHYNVPFNVSENLPNLTVSNIYPLNIGPDLGVSSLPFNGPNGELYVIIDEEGRDPQEFLEQVSQQHYFDLEEQNHKNDLALRGAIGQYEPLFF